MKKMLTILAATIAATASMGQTTNQVLSRNAVGYVKISTTANKYNLYGMPFKSLDGSPLTPAKLLGVTGIPDGTTLIVWSRSAHKYETETFLDLTPDPSVWDPGTNIVNSADGFWLASPTSTNFYLMGEVPDATTNPTNNSTIVHGFQLLAYPYPVALNLTNTTLAAAGDNDALLQFTGTNYLTYTYIYDPDPSVAGWYDDIGNRTGPVLQPGKGYWYKREALGNTNWAQPKPYTWP